MTRAESWFNDKECNKVDGKDDTEDDTEKSVTLPGQLTDEEINTDSIRTKAHDIALYLSHNHDNMHMTSVRNDIKKIKIELADMVIRMLYGTEDV